jgi:hypothetical protein
MDRCHRIGWLGNFNAGPLASRRVVPSYFSGVPLPVEIRTGLPTFSIFATALLLASAAAGLGEAPTGFRNFKWGNPPRGAIKKFSGPTDEGLTVYIPLSKKPEPLFDIPVAEEEYSFVHGRFYQSDAYFDGEPNLYKMKAALIRAFGNPSFTNESLKIWKWKWPNKQIEIQLYFQAKFARSTVTFSNSAIN